MGSFGKSAATVLPDASSALSLCPLPWEVTSGDLALGPLSQGSLRRCSRSFLGLFPFRGSYPVISLFLPSRSPILSSIISLLLLSLSTEFGCSIFSYKTLFGPSGHTGVMDAFLGLAEAFCSADFKADPGGHGCSSFLLGVALSLFPPTDHR